MLRMILTLHKEHLKDSHTLLPQVQQRTTVCHAVSEHNRNLDNIFKIKNSTMNVTSTVGQIL
jgi:hypothetical protein